MRGVLLLCALCLSCATTKPDIPALQPTTQDSVPSTNIKKTEPAAALTPASAPSSTPASAPATTAGEQCAKIDAVIDAELYRGSPPKSQSQLAAASAYKGKDYERDDHFLKYVSCEYKTSINGSPYSYQYYISDVTLIDEMKPSMCEAWREKVEAHIISVTDGCTDLKGGEFYGYIFTPMK